MTSVPPPISRLADLMASFDPIWSLCGGWAVDAWIGYQTREHEDVDIAVFDDDQRAIFDQLRGWKLIAHDTLVAGDTGEPWNGRPLELPAHIHADSHDGFNLEVLLNERSNGDWVLSREPFLTVPVAHCAEPSAWGLPTLVPELLLYFKATEYFGEEGYDRPHDELDFFTLLDRLTESPRLWLRDTVSLVHPSHPWLDRFSI
jgi:Aminoglycoside-2''-adenylyltransferase